MANLLCIETLSTTRITFKDGEIYKGNKINNNWWCVDAVGVEAKIFDKHFVNKDYISGLKIGKKDTNSEDEELKMVSE